MRLKSGILSLFLILFLSSVVYGQFILNIGLGGTGYQGDISPFSNRISFVTNNKLAFHTEIGFQQNNYLNYKFGFLSGRISASDSNAKNARKYRNLSFKSRINEITLTAEVDLFEFFSPNYNVSRFHPFFKFGVGGFHFNPQAKYRGEYIDLQPLGTEGQGMSAYPDRKKYSLYQFNIPFGLGLLYEIDDRLSILGQFTPRWTFTDYIDDVSTTYVNYEDLKAGNGQIAADLSDRSREIGGGEDVRIGARGNSSEKDWYFFLGVDISYKFEMRRVKGIFNKDYRVVTCKTY